MNPSSVRASRMAVVGGSRVILGRTRSAFHALLPFLLLACSPGVRGSDGYLERPIAEADELHDSFTGVVTRISDGDTLRVDVQDPGTSGLPVGANVRVRLLRIDTPELAHGGQPPECLAEEAAAHLARLAPMGTILKLGYDVQRRDQYSRELAHAWLPDGTWINGQMLEDGYAVVVTYPPNVAYGKAALAAQRAARTARRGLWNPARCG